MDIIVQGMKFNGFDDLFWILYTRSIELYSDPNNTMM